MPSKTISTPIAIGVVFVVAVAVAGFVWWQNINLKLTSQNLVLQQQQEQSKTEESPTSEVDTSNWKTYRNEEYGFEMRYPLRTRLEEEGNLEELKGKIGKLVIESTDYSPGNYFVFIVFSPEEPIYIGKFSGAIYPFHKLFKTNCREISYHYRQQCQEIMLNNNRIVKIPDLWTQDNDWPQNAYVINYVLSGEKYFYILQVSQERLWPKERIPELILSTFKFIK